MATIAELKQEAQTIGVDIKGLKTKADISLAISNFKLSQADKDPAPVFWCNNNEDVSKVETDEGETIDITYKINEATRTFITPDGKKANRIIGVVEED